jgi:hypothetical protein
LLAIFNVTASYRLAEAQRALESELGHGLHSHQINELACKSRCEVETADMPIPPISEFSEERLEEALRLSMLRTLRVIGLDIHQQTPDFSAVDGFLRKRHRFTLTRFP